MTPQEAIQRVEQHNEYHSKRERFAVYITEALNMAVESLQKQIPKKVEEWLPFYKAKCPSCNGHIEAHASNLYCCRCGQALDWSDTE